jgi:hypothetical protein
VVQPGQNGGLALELVASFLKHFLRQSAVIFHLFNSTEAALQAQVISQVDTAHSTLSNDLFNLVPFPEYRTSLHGDWHRV